MGHVVVAEADQRGWVKFRIRLQDDAGFHLILLGDVGGFGANDCAVKHVGMAQDHALHFEGRYILAPAPQRVFHAINEIEEAVARSEEHTSELQSLMRISNADLRLKK